MLLWNSTDPCQISVTGLLPCVVQLSRNLHLPSMVSYVAPKPQRCFHPWFGLLQFRSPLLPQSFVYFLFLRLLRCFSSAGSPHCTMNSCNDATVLTVRVSTFGNLRVIDYVHLTAAYRSLSRPSSAPSAKASPICSL